MFAVATDFRLLSLTRRRLLALLELPVLMRLRIFDPAVRLSWQASIERAEDDLFHQA